MSRRGNCHDNAVAESFYQHGEEGADQAADLPHPGRRGLRVFDYIEMFCNPVRRHRSAGGVSPVEFERRYVQRGR